MKRVIILSMLIISVSFAPGFTSFGRDIKETRNASGFTSVNFGIAGDLYVSIGQEFEVILEGDEDFVRQIETDVSGDRLQIRLERWRFNFGFRERVTVYITMPEIEGLSVSGSGRAEILDAFKTDELDLSVSGSGKLYTSDIEASEMDCNISGSGDIIFNGRGDVKWADISISGSGNYDGDNIRVEEMEVSISGSGNCRCHATESLRARVSGSGSIYYEGNPSVDARVSGSGRVRSG
jgi:hypothetical protein